MNIYNNRFFNNLKTRVENGMKKDVEKVGGIITDHAKFQKESESNTKMDYWIFSILILLFAYELIVFVLKFIKK